MYEFTPVGWLKHCIFHPVEGFEDLRWKKQGSMKIALIIVFFLFVAMVADRQLTGFQFNNNYVKIFNVVPLIVQSVVYYFTWCVGNWSICTLVKVIFSNFLVQEESIWITALTYLGFGWSIVLMIQAMRACHQYSFGKTLISMVLTLVAMLLILFLAILLLSLFQQVYVFIYQIYTEIAYRIRG